MAVAPDIIMTFVTVNAPARLFGVMYEPVFKKQGMFFDRNMMLFSVFPNALTMQPLV